MKKCLILAVVLLVSSPFANIFAAEYSYFWNKTLTNNSTEDVFDVEVILRGKWDIKEEDVYKGEFGGVEIVTTSDNKLTIVHWKNPPAPIAKEAKTHIGIKTEDSIWFRDVKDIHWTNKFGFPIAKSVVFNAEYDKTFKNMVRLGNFTTPLDTAGFPITDPWAAPRPVTAMDIRYAIISTPIPLEELNNENILLNDTLLQPLSPMITIPYGTYIDILSLDSAYIGQYLVVRWDNYAPSIDGSDSTCARDWVQCKIISTTSQIPTLTEWGLIIFGALLAGIMTWVFLRRRKAATIGI